VDNYFDIGPEGMDVDEFSRRVDSLVTKGHTMKEAVDASIDGHNRPQHDRDPSGGDPEGTGRGERVGDRLGDDRDQHGAPGHEGRDLRGATEGVLAPPDAQAVIHRLSQRIAELEILRAYQGAQLDAMLIEAASQRERAERAEVIIASWDDDEEAPTHP
jgi:hypothetical protein